MCQKIAKCFISANSVTSQNGEDINSHELNPNQSQVQLKNQKTTKKQSKAPKMVKFKTNKFIYAKTRMAKFCKRMGHNLFRKKVGHRLNEEIGILTNLTNILLLILQITSKKVNVSYFCRFLSNFIVRRSNLELTFCSFSTNVPDQIRVKFFKHFY